MTDYRARGYWRDRTLGRLLTETARKWPERTALVDGDRRWTYAELDKWADLVAAGLHGNGIGKGDRVIVHLPNVAEFVALSFGLFRVGAVPVYALPQHRTTEIEHLTEVAQPSQYFGSVEDVPDAGPVALEGPEPDDVALMLLSGGTTGLPKLIPRTHNDYDYNLRASAELCGLDENTVYLAALPVAHNFALACPGVLGTFHAGGTVVLTTSADPETAFPLIERERVTMTALVPPLALVWLDHGGLTGLKLMQVGGSRLKEEAARRIRPELGCDLQQVYGMAEGLLNFTRLDDPEEVKVTTQGRPMSPDDEIRVVDGELQVKGPYTITTYFDGEHGSFTEDGFYRTGDLVKFVGDNLVVDGRKKDVINRGGDKIPVEEVENLLLSHPQVHDVAIVGVPDAYLGERTCAVVIPHGTAPTRRDLVEHLQALGVADFKLPDRVRIVAEFPRTAVGKVDRKAL